MAARCRYGSLASIGLLLSDHLEASLASTADGATTLPTARANGGGRTVIDLSQPASKTWHSVLLQCGSGIRFLPYTCSRGVVSVVLKAECFAKSPKERIGPSLRLLARTYFRLRKLREACSMVLSLLLPWLCAKALSKDELTGCLASTSWLRCEPPLTVDLLLHYERMITEDLILTLCQGIIRRREDMHVNELLLVIVVYILSVLLDSIYFIGVSSSSVGFARDQHGFWIIMEINVLIVLMMVSLCVVRLVAT